MSDVSLNLKVTATDVTQTVFNGVKKGLEGINNATKAISDSMGNLGRLLSAGAAFAGFRTIINAASDLEESTSKLNIIFDETAESAKTMSTELTKSFGYSKAEANNALVSFGNLFQNMGFGQKTSLDLSSKLTKLASDMSAFADVPINEVLADLQRGMTGATMGLKQYGIAITDAQVKEEALAQGLSDGKRELSAQEKAFVTYNLILKQTTAMQGEFARSTDSYQVQLRKAKAEMENAASSFGSIFIPKLVEILKFINELPNAIKILIVAIPPLVAAFVALGGPLTAIVAAIGGIVYVAAKLNSAFNDASQITIKYAESLNDINKEQELLARVQEKITAAVEESNRTYKIASQTSSAAAWEKNKEAVQEEMRLKNIRNILNEKIATQQKEIKATEDAAAAALKKEAEEAAALERRKLAKEQALKDEKKKEEQDAEDKKKRDEDVANFIKDMNVEVQQNEFDQKRVALEQWHLDKLDLVKGNLEAEMLLDKEYTQQKNAIQEEETQFIKDENDKRVAVAKAADKAMQQSAMQSVSQLSKDFDIIASEFKEFFGIAKAAAIAEATMKGYEAAVNAYTWASAWGGPIAGGIAAGVAAVATGIQIAKIAATPPPYQTATDQMRTIPGPSNRETIITAHGGERIGRQGQSGITIQVMGDMYSADESIPKIAEALRYYTKNTGYVIQGA